MMSYPYHMLHIYVFSGRLSEKEEAGLGDGFLGNWVEGECSFLFFGRPAREEIRRLLAARPDLRLDDEYRFSYDQWQGGRLEPVRIDPFLIVPPWVECDPVEGLTTILLDPGVVFGNCLHPTTRDSLKALAWSRGRRSFRRVLDLGTGTGVLALAAARLGAESVSAVDLNPLCVRTAARNVMLNGLGGIVEVKQGRAEDFAEDPADLVIANIHAEVIRALLGMEAFRGRDRLILSGLMRSQAREIRAELIKAGYAIVREWDDEMTWFTLVAV
jgi:ribosomal protein L11 methyltransferase